MSDLGNLLKHSKHIFSRSTKGALLASLVAPSFPSASLVRYVPSHERMAKLGSLGTGMTEKASQPPQLLVFVTRSCGLRARVLKFGALLSNKTCTRMWMECEDTCMNVNGYMTKKMTKNSLNKKITPFGIYTFIQFYALYKS